MTSYKGKVIDVCLHHNWQRDEELVAYMPKAWRTFMGTPGSLPGGSGLRRIHHAVPYHHPLGDSVELMTPESMQLYLRRHDIVRGVLCFDAALMAPALNNQRLANVVCQAANDWSCERWLEGRKNLLGTIIVPTQSPDKCVSEIRRLARTGKMHAVLLCGNGLSRPFGHPEYLPIWKAAADLGLPVIVHAGGDANYDTSSHPTAGGLASTYTEYRVLAAQALMTHTASIIGQGVFMRFRDLRVILVGGGIGWIPSFIWRFSQNYKELRSEAPWLKQSPEETFRQHVRVCTFGTDPNVSPTYFHEYLDAFGDIASVLCYGSGYPASDYLSVEEAKGAMPIGWQDAVFYENAARLWGLASYASSRGSTA